MEQTNWEPRSGIKSAWDRVFSLGRFKREKHSYVAFESKLRPKVPEQVLTRRVASEKRIKHYRNTQYKYRVLCQNPAVRVQVEEDKEFAMIQVREKGRFTKERTRIDFEIW